VVVCPALIDELSDVLGREKFAKHAAEGCAAAVCPGSARPFGRRPPAGPAKTADDDDDY
jgi:hypothetical protein